MSTVKKMYVVPSDFYESLMQRTKIVSDPIQDAQVETEKEKTKIVKNRKPKEQKVKELQNVLHKQNVLREQTRIKERQPIRVIIDEHVDEEYKKKRGRPPKQNKTFPEFDITGSGDGTNYKNNQNFKQKSFLDNFYMYEPTVRKNKRLS